MFLYKRVFEEFNRNRVRYVVVGGYAVVLHGYPRLTVDADIVVSFEPENARQAIGCLLKLGLVPRVPVDPREFADAEVRQSWVEEKGLMVFTMIDPVNPFFAVDLFVDPPIGFDELEKSAVNKNLDGVPVRICSLSHLIAMKRAAGRPEDLSDVKALLELGDE